MIPLLIVGEDLSDLANDMGDLGAAGGVTPILAHGSEDALSIHSDFGPRLMAVVLHPEAQEAYEQLREAGYRGAFLVYGEETGEWHSKDVTFLDPGETERVIYDKVMAKLLE
ncbi:MAG: hypothetical protein KAT43_02610 [Nanoarchaeota archaeon]|nr:hypothetical protein [Nanoarchaeota archaeon]